MAGSADREGIFCGCAGGRGMCSVGVRLDECWLAVRAPRSRLRRAGVVVGCWLPGGLVSMLERVMSRAL